MESGYDTFVTPSGALFDFAQLGSSMPLWLADKGGTRFSVELDEWIQTLAVQLSKGQCPYQTVVLGGFSMMQQLIIAEAFRMNPGLKGQQRAWGDVSQWMRKVLQTLCTLPVHVLFEVSAKDSDKDQYTGAVKKYEPMLSGQGGKNLEYSASAIMWMEPSPYGVAGYLYDLPHARTKVRLMSLWTNEPIINPCYDWFAARMGLPSIPDCDPKHPRCNPGVWPWPHPHN